MSGRPLPRSRLDALVPSLLAGQALVALVPATGDQKWAAGAAWDVARAAARGGRRVALVDLWLEHPTLHEVVGLNPTEGIVDAFEYEVSLTKAAHEVDHVFFIAAGTVTAHAGDLFANPRWKKLHGGFRVEDALLCLFLSAGALARLSSVPDGLIVLSPDGYEPESSIGQGIAAAMERGMPLIGVVRERWTPVAAPVPEARATAPPPGRISATHGRAARPRARPAVVAVTLAVGTAGGWALLARGAPQRFAVAPAAPPRPPAGAAASPAAATPSALPAPQTTPPPSAPRRDSLPWTVQLIAYSRLDKALGLADRIGARGIVPFVTPVAIGPRRSTIWYRVLAGGYRTRDSAVAVRQVLWDRGLARRGQGDVLRAPYSYAVSGPASAEELRARGIPVVSRAGDGRFWVGAFETPEQANVLAARLRRAGVPATLVTRMGTTP